MPEVELVKLSALQNTIDATNTAKTQAESAAADALTVVDADPNYISYEVGTKPSTSGATEGTIGAYFTSSGLLQKLELVSGAWEDVGDPITTKGYTDSRAAMSGNLSTRSELKEYKGIHESQTIRITGLINKNDNLGGEFYWDSTSELTADDINIIKVTDVDTGRWKRLNVPNPLKGNAIDLVNNEKHKGLCSGVFVLPQQDKWLIWWREASIHGVDENSVIKMGSTFDKGATVVNIKTIYNENGIDARNGTYGLMNNGRVGIILDRRDLDGALPPVFLYSDDEGATWSSDILTSPSTFSSYNQFTKYPTSAGGADSGGWVCYGSNPSSNTSIIALYTTDNGDTWSNTVAISPSQTGATETFSEPSVVRIGTEDKWIMAIRRNNEDNLTIFISKSTDLINWTDPIEGGITLSKNPPYLFYREGRVWLYAPSRGSRFINNIDIQDYYLYTSQDPDVLWSTLQFPEWETWFKVGKGYLLGYLTIFESNGGLFGILASNEQNTEGAQLYMLSANDFGSDYYINEGTNDFEPNPNIIENIDSIGSVDYCHFYRVGSLIFIECVLKDVVPTSTGVARLEIDLPYPTRTNYSIPSGTVYHPQTKSIGAVVNRSSSINDKVIVFVDFIAGSTADLSIAFTYLTDYKY